MRFEARDLQPYAEPVSPDDLCVGTIYFSVQYIDDHLLIPVVTPLVFIGRVLMTDDHGTLYFQDAESHRDGVRFESDWPKDAVFLAQGEHEINFIFEYERALDLLLVCSLRRIRRQ